MTFEDFRSIQNRREFLQKCAGGFGSIALAQLMASEGLLATAANADTSVNPLAACRT